MRSPAVLAWCIGGAACVVACAPHANAVGVAMMAGAAVGYAGFAWVVCAVMARV